MSKREKIAWICLLSTVAVYTPYFAYVYRLISGGGFRIWAVLGALLAAIVLQSLLTAFATAFLTFRQRAEPRDERDAVIEARAYRIAYFLIAALAAALAFGLPGLLVSPEFAHADSRMALLLASQALLLCFVLAEAARYLTLAVSYRRGA